MEMENKIREDFMKGYDCSQVVCSKFADKLGIDRNTAEKMSAAFGGGMQQGKTCGAYTGALIVLGLAYGHTDETDLMAQKEIMIQKMAEFREHFLNIFETDECKELIGYDVSTPEGLQGALDSGKLLDYCPYLVEKVINILEDML